MCKALVMENVDWQPTPSSPQETDTDTDTHTHTSRRNNSRYYMIILQYTATLNEAKLKKAIHALNNTHRHTHTHTHTPSLPLSNFRFRLAPEETSQKLTGYTHNAVTPFGLPSSTIPDDLPIVLAADILNIKPPFIYMGGGHVNCKLGCRLVEFVRALDPIVAHVSDPR
jgi:prolyl-tRNA editing enzyme YbaK/EbsC (Cys-tRNA(Pro) deacylase)